MQQKNLIILALIFSIFIIFSAVFAQESSPVTFPVKELGNCRNFKECAIFCDKPQNAKVCTEFAEGQGMISQDDALMSKRMIDSSEMGGPGGCKGKDECDVYCGDMTHIDECIAFAEEHGFMPPEEIDEAKAVSRALKAGAKMPGNCRGKEECEKYCDEPAHIEECVAFGEAAGFIRPEEAQMVRKTGGKGPGNCRGKAQCDTYCNTPEHMEECMNFAIEHNLMPPEEREEAQKFLEAVKKGAKPPNCRGREECDKYCSQPEHAEECIEFGIAAGFIPPEEAEQVRKMAKAGLMGGPGGCKGKAECEAYCDNPDHMAECIDFGEKAGFISPEQAQQARKMGEMGMRGGPGGCKGPEECQAFCDNPDHSQECMDFGVKMGMMSPEEAERGMKMMRGGPGGCKGEECKTYCEDMSHQEECFKFAKENNLVPAKEIERMEKGAQIMQQGGPGGCRGPQECEVYCLDHREECMKWGQEGGFAPPSGETGGPGKGVIMPPEGMMPPPGMQQPPEGWQGPMPPGGTAPPEGYQKPPEGFVPPPEGYTPPSTEYTPPPTETTPPPTTEQPTSFEQESFLGIILRPFLNLFR